MEIDILIYGFGGHGRVLAELLFENGFRRIGVFDDSEQLNYPPYITYLGPYNSQTCSNTKLIISIGNNKQRAELAKNIRHQYATFVHPMAYVSSTATLSEGVVILQGAVVQANSKIGFHTIINIGAKIDHDVQIGDFVHIAPQSYVGSNSIISSFIDLNPGQIIPRISKL